MPKHNPSQRLPMNNHLEDESAQKSAFSSLLPESHSFLEHTAHPEPFVYWTVQIGWEKGSSKRAPLLTSKAPCLL